MSTWTSNSMKSMGNRAAALKDRTEFSFTAINLRSDDANTFIPFPRCPTTTNPEAPRPISTIPANQPSTQTIIPNPRSTEKDANQNHPNASSLPLGWILVIGSATAGLSGTSATSTVLRAIRVSTKLEIQERERELRTETEGKKKVVWGFYKSFRDLFRKWRGFVIDGT